MKTHEFTVDLAGDGKRVDVFLVDAGLGLSRRRIRLVIDVGGVYVNRKRVRVASWAVRRGDKIRMQYSDSALSKIKSDKPAFRPEDLLFDQFGVFAINKPPGMASQATRDQAVVHVVPCLEELLNAQERKHGTLVLVHRLDKETSGVILVADGNERATWLTDQFRERKVSKTYLAICHGVSRRDQFTESSPLSEIDKKSGNVRAVRSGGRSAVTRFRVLATNAKLHLTLMECKPETGRSHQIRVHLALNHLPIVGDKRYGEKLELPPGILELTQVHHMLHAHALEFKPTRTASPVRIEAPSPERFSALRQKADL